MTETARAGFFSILHTSGVLEGRAETKLAEVGLSLPKLAALNRFSEAGGSLPLGQLAERLSCVKSNVTQLVDRLEADGLVNRTADPTDRRSRIAVLTDAGRAAYEQGIQIQQQTERDLFGALSPHESAQLHQLLAKLER